MFSSLLRAVFGVGILIAANRLYGGTAKEILSFCKSKTAILSGISFLAYLLYYIITVCAGCERIIGVPENLLFAGIVLQQITTGFYEELNYRFLILEGYFYGAETVRNRRLYAMISSFVFWIGACCDRLECNCILLARDDRVCVCCHISKVKESCCANAAALCL